MRCLYVFFPSLPLSDTDSCCLLQKGGKGGKKGKGKGDAEEGVELDDAGKLKRAEVRYVAFFGTNLGGLHAQHV